MKLQIHRSLSFRLNSQPDFYPLRCRVWPSPLPVPVSRDERPCSRLHHTGAWHQPHQWRHPWGLRAQWPDVTPGVPSPPPQTPQWLGAAQWLWRTILTWPPTWSWRHAAPQHAWLRSLTPSPPPERECHSPESSPNQERWLHSHCAGGRFKLIQVLFNLLFVLPCQGGGMYTALPQTESSDCMSCQNLCNNNRLENLLVVNCIQLHPINCNVPAQKAQ